MVNGTGVESVRRISKIKNRQLYYKKGGTCRNKRKQGQQQVGNEWQQCIKIEEEKERVLKSCHSSTTGS